MGCPNLTASARGIAFVAQLILRAFNFTELSVIAFVNAFFAVVDMVETSKSKIEKIKHPQNYYETPDALIKDTELSPEEKKKALDVWEQDARQMLTASNEGMPGHRGSEHLVNRALRCRVPF